MWFDLKNLLHTYFKMLLENLNTVLRKIGIPTKSIFFLYLFVLLTTIAHCCYMKRLPAYQQELLTRSLEKLNKTCCC